MHRCRKRTERFPSADHIRRGQERWVRCIARHCCASATRPPSDVSGGGRFALRSMSLNSCASTSCTLGSAASRRPTVPPTGAGAARSIVIEHIACRHLHRRLRGCDAKDADAGGSAVELASAAPQCVRRAGRWTFAVAAGVAMTRLGGDACAGSLLAHELHDVERLCLWGGPAFAIIAGRGGGNVEAQRQAQEQGGEANDRAKYQGVLPTNTREPGAIPPPSVTSAWRNCGIVGAIPWLELRLTLMGRRRKAP